MVSRITTLLAFIAVASSASAALDLTPTPGVRELEGIKFQQLLFHDGNRTVSYEAPRGWNYYGGGNRLELIPQNLSLAKASIDVRPLSATAISVADLQAAALRDVPEMAGNSQLFAENGEAVAIDGQATVEVTIGYTISGQRFAKSVYLLPRSDCELVFTVISRATDFEKVRGAFQQSLCGLQWSPPSR
jgi:hypothetical protein